MSENIMKRLKVLTKAQFLELPEIDANVRYFITDMPENQIDNADMALAITTESALYNAGDIFICKDTDTYEKGHIYQLNNTKDAWEDITPASASPTIIGTTDPTTSTVGEVGQFYLNTATGKLFICKSITSGTPDTYTWSEVGPGERLYLHRMYFTGNPNRQFSQVRFSVLCSKSTAFSSFNDFCSYFADKYQFMPILSKGILMYASIASDRIELKYPTITSTLNEDNTITSVIDYNSIETTYSNDSGTMFDAVSPV